MAKQKMYRAAVIGCGNIGAAVGNYNKAVQPGTHAGAYQKHKRTTLVALVENNIERHAFLKKNFPKVQLFADPEQMFKEIKPDVVSIATPTALHYNLVLMAARYKTSAILCEKPIAYTIPEAEKMIAACKKSNSVLFINHQRRYDPLLNDWSQKIKKGFLGAPFQATANYYNGFFNAATHLIDLLRMFLGEPVRVIAKYNETTSSQENDPNIDGMMFFKNGAVATLQSLSKNYGHFGFSLFGDKGWIGVTNLGFEVQYRSKVKNANYKGYFELSKNIKSEGKPRSLIIASVDTVVRCLDGKLKPYGIGEDGLAVLKILQAFKKSADQSGKEVQV